MGQEKYQGVFPAFCACYDRGGEVSPRAVRELTRYLIGKGVNGLYVGGSSGECIYQSVEERKQTLENVMEEAAGRVTVIAHVACNNTKDSCELAAHAQSLGVDAVAAIPPIYFHLPERAIAAYWNAISAAAPDTDFILYNIPQFAGVALTLPLLREMKKNPRVVGVKSSSPLVQDIQMFRGEGVFVFNGQDEQFVPALAAGAVGGVGGTYTAAPELFLRARALFLAGKWEEARNLQDRICAIIARMYSAQGNFYAVLKEILRRRCGPDAGGVRAPLPELEAGDGVVVESCVAMIEEALAI